MPSSRAISAPGRPECSSRRTASSLNSFVKCFRVSMAHLPGGSIVPLFGVHETRATSGLAFRHRVAEVPETGVGMQDQTPKHVVVCGAGVMGAAVSYFLASRGVAVTVVERCGVACAASGKSGGFLALDWCDGSELGPLARASFALHAELARQLGADYGYRRMDTFMLAARERGTPAGGHNVDTPRWIDGAG